MGIDGASGAHVGSWLISVKGFHSSAQTQLWEPDGPLVASQHVSEGELCTADAVRDLGGFRSSA